MEAQPLNESRVLIYAPTGRDSELTCRFLGAAKISAQSCRDMSDLVRQVEQGCGAIVLAEETLGTTSVMALTAVLARQPFWSEMPVCIIATAGIANHDISRRLAMFGPVGNVTVLERPFRPETLVNTLQVALRSRQRQYEVRDLMAALAESERRYRELAASLEEQVKARTFALEETNKELESFTYTIAHDLRAPLRAQESFAKALLEDYGDALGTRGCDFAHRIIESATRLNHLVRDLLAVSRVSRAEVSTEVLDLHSVVLGVCKEMDFQVKEQNATVNVGKFDFKVLANEAMLVMTITNLLSNAIKFHKKGIAPQIAIDAKQNGQWVRLSVRDNGIGIAPEHHQQVFGVFNRLHKAGEYPGTGVGLAIVQKAMERMNGKVGLNSELGEGCEFWIELRQAQ